MSSLLERAIVDANELKEAAQKNAEQFIVEKYSSEVKEALEKILELDDEVELEDVAGIEGEEGVGVLAQIPSAATTGDQLCPCPDDEEEIEINFDELLAAVDAEARPSGEEDLVDRDEELVAEDKSVAEGKDAQPIEATDDELSEVLAELSERDIETLLEDIECDVQAVPSGWLGSNRATRTENIEIEKLNDALAEIQVEHKTLQDQRATLLEGTKKRTQKTNKVLIQLKEKLIETNLQNARLFYENKVLSDKSLNTLQKEKLVQSISNSESPREAKLVYETLKDTVGTRTPSVHPKSLVEAVNKTRSLVVAGKKPTTNQTSNDPVYSHWKKLAGLDKNKGEF